MDIPKWITEIKRDKKRRKWIEMWKQPWEVPTSKLRARGFKKALWQHGHVTPHYSRAEARCKDGTGVPDGLRGNCQKQGFLLERARHAQGDRPLRVLSWYRTPAYNASVGGASASQHMYARACDIDTPIAVAVANRIWANGGIGYQGRINGPVRHVDCGPKRRWTY